MRRVHEFFPVARASEERELLGTAESVQPETSVNVELSQANAKLLPCALSQRRETWKEHYRALKSIAKDTPCPA